MLLRNLGSRSLRLAQAIRAPHGRLVQSKAPASLIANRRNGFATTIDSKDIHQANEILKQGNDALDEENPNLALTKYLESIQIHPTCEGFFNAGNVLLQMGMVHLPQD
jgi:hypothetical protein